jgi:hypothetical protein
VAIGGGPDVIVGDMDELGKYTTPTEDPQAFATSTISCNVGDVNLEWFANTNRHPVIGQNMFRLTTVGGARRIEQIGQAWLKHGFTALAGNLCSTCNGVSGTYLGVGCSDPYSASLNAATGTRTVLGPKSNINAASGFFPYTSNSNTNLRYDYTEFAGGVSPAATGNAARRLQVFKADLNDTGALFFIEGQYVAPDDTETLNDWNNTSYRHISVANTGTSPTYAITFFPGSTTQRTKPAIHAWRDHGLGANTPDPSVILQPIDLPGDGLVWVGHKVTDLGNGQFVYDYALQNLTSDRSISSVSIPLGLGASVVSTNFRDVVYHSGEEAVYDPSDWTATVSGSAVVFSAPTPPAGMDPNAIRWGTMYNFRVVSTAAPAQSKLTMGLLKPGAYATYSLAVATPGGGTGGTEAPANDSCANAELIADGPTGGSTVNATSAGPDECLSRSSAAINNDLWYRYTYSPTSACSGNLEISLCGSTFDTRMAVYSGSTCPTTPGTAIACNDDDLTGCTTSTGTSRVVVPVVSGQSLLIRVGGFGVATGNFTLTLTPPSCGPVTGACCATNGTCSVVQASNCTGSSQYQGDNTTCAAVTCPARGTCCIAASGACTITFASGCTGTGTTWTSGALACTPNPCPQPPAPANDLCTNAIWIADGVTIQGANTNATTDGAVQNCSTGNSSGRDVWYKYRPAVSGNVRFTTDQAVATGATTNFDTVLSVHSACGGAATTLACDDDAGNSPANSSNIASVNLTADVTYLVRVSGYGSPGATGLFALRAIGGGGTIPAPPSNDGCQNRRGSSDGTLAFDTTDATTDGPINAACAFASPSQIDKDVWLNYPATLTGTLTISLCGSSFDTRLAVYRDPSCTDFDTRLVGCNDDFCGTSSQLTVNIIQGTSYVIRIGGANNAGGTGTVTLTSTPALGACCRGTTCVSALAADCAPASGQSFTSAGTGCNTAGNAVSPCCRADYNKAGGVTIDDIFIYLNAWFASSRLTDISTNGENDPTIDDIFIYLNAWFAGCS